MAEQGPGFLQRFAQRLGSPRRAAILMAISTVLMIVAQLVPQEQDFTAEEFRTMLAEEPVQLGMMHKIGLTGVYGSWVFAATLGLLTLSLALNTWQRARKVPAQVELRLVKRSPKRLSHMKAYAAVDVPEVVADPIAAAEIALQWSRYATVRDEGALRGLHGRYSVLGSLLFHLSLVLVALGWTIGIQPVLPAWGKFHGTIMLTEGERFTGTRDQYQSFTPVELAEADLPALDFTLEDLEVVYDGFDNVVDAAATFKLADESTQTVRVNYPLRSGTTAVRLVDYGFAPVFLALDPAVGEQQIAAFKLSLMPAGRTDQFAFPNLQRMFDMRLYPNHYLDEAGQPQSRSREPLAPVAYLKVTAPDGTTEEVQLEPGWRRQYAAGVLVAMPEVRYYARLEVHRDGTRALVFAGMILGFLGLMWRLFYPIWTIDVTLETLADGRRVLHLGGTADYTVEPFLAHFDRVVTSLRKELAK